MEPSVSNTNSVFELGSETMVPPRIEVDFCIHKVPISYNLMLFSKKNRSNYNNKKSVFIHRGNSNMDLSIRRNEEILQKEFNQEEQRPILSESQLEEKPTQTPVREDIIRDNQNIGTLGAPKPTS